MKRYTQQYGIDYTETFLPIVKITTVRTLLSLAIKKGWTLFQLDVNNVFLHRDLHEEEYMEPPQGLLLEDTNLVCRLKKSLYVLKQASRQWYDKLVESLCSRGFTHSVHDYSLFFKKHGKSMVFVAVYVDDIILTGNDLNEIQQLKQFQDNKFKIKDLG